MTDVRAIHVDEPKLLFGHGQRCEYVKDGLFSFGPLSGLPGGSGLRFGLIGQHREFVASTLGLKVFALVSRVTFEGALNGLARIA